MYNIFRFVSLVSILLAVVLAAAVVQPEWARDVGLDPYVEQALEYWGLVLHVPGIEPGPRVEAMDRRYYAKERISLEVLDGRLTLLEAAALFRQLNKDNPTPLIVLGRPGTSEDELYCWQVIEYVAGLEARQCNSSQDDKEGSGRLKEELRRHIEQHGQVILPDVMHVLKARSVSDREKQDAPLSPVQNSCVHS